jgi:hypothetical protein
VQPGFSAGFLKELLTREAVLDSHLGQEEPAVRMEDDEQPVLPNLDCFRSNRLQVRKQRDLHAQMFELILLHGSKSWIFHCRTAGAPDDGLPQRFAGFGHPNAALQMPAHVKRNEHSAAFRKDSIAGNEVWKFSPEDGIDYRIAR